MLRTFYASLFLAAAATPAFGKTLTFELDVRVARCARDKATPSGLHDRSVKAFRSVQPDSWVHRQVARVKELFGTYGIRVKLASLSPFTPKRCILLTRADRHAMGIHVPALKPPRVTVLVLERIRDIDVLSYNLMGVHWRHNRSAKRWVFLTTRATSYVLAHELAHFFGLRHDPKGGNLLTPGPSSPHWLKKPGPRPFAPRLTPAQARRLRAGIRRFVASGHTPASALPHR